MNAKAVAEAAAHTRHRASEVARTMLHAMKAAVAHWPDLEGVSISDRPSDHDGGGTFGLALGLEVQGSEISLPGGIVAILPRSGRLNRDGSGFLIVRLGRRVKGQIQAPEIRLPLHIEGDTVRVGEDGETFSLPLDERAAVGLWLHLFAMIGVEVPQEVAG